MPFIFIYVFRVYCWPWSIRNLVFVNVRDHKKTFNMKYIRILCKCVFCCWWNELNIIIQIKDMEEDSDSGEETEVRRPMRPREPAPPPPPPPPSSSSQPQPPPLPPQPTEVIIKKDYNPKGEARTRLEYLNPET